MGCALIKRNVNTLQLTKKERDHQIQRWHPAHKKRNATYLGGNLQANGAARPEVESRIAKAAHVFGKLAPLWKDSACATTWKLRLRVFEAVVLAVLFYGLDSVVLTKALKDRLDYFHTKCIRHILRIKAAFYSKVSNRTSPG